MAEYFTSDHFKLLNKWKGVEYDSTNPEQQKVYADLTAAYNLTKKWSEQLQAKAFPGGWTKTVRKPTDQWQKKFIPYNWARIYPTKSSPLGLAYTVGIDADVGFVIKLDLVDIKVDDPNLRPKYDAIRGAFDDSPIVAILSVAEGLAKSLGELVDWSIEEIKKFSLSYEELAQELELISKDDFASTLDSFRQLPDFIKWQPKWGEEYTSLFCRFVHSVHDAGLDIWLTGASYGHIRFGRKDKEWKKGKPLGFITLGLNTFEVSWRVIAELPAVDDSVITAAIVEKMEKFASSRKDGKRVELFSDADRSSGFWPDEYKSELEGECAQLALERKPFNRIYYGPPGTGKTYRLLNLLNTDYTDSKTKEDPESWLVEQVRDRNWFQIIALILLEAGKSIKVADIVGHQFYQAKAKANGRTQNLTQNAWGYLQRHTWSKSKTVDSAKERRAEIAIFDKDDKSNWYIVDELKEQLADMVPVLALLTAGPAVGAVNKRYAFVTFHQSYGYEEFVEGIRPELGNDATDQVRYEIPRGVLRRLCEKAEADPGNFYAMVIDEINRGNISKIFGELITLIETDKRAGSDLAVPVVLPYSGDTFIIPPNVDFIGTMNTADRSLALVDTALRRRFEFVPIMPEPDVLTGLAIVKDGVTIEVRKLLTAINNRVEALYDRDHTIGHAYFTDIAGLPAIEQFSALKKVFQNKIIPLLEEYFFEDWQKIRLVLGDNQKKEKFQFIKDAGREEDLAALFGVNHELDQYAIRPRFRYDEATLDLPQAYLGIYTPAGTASGSPSQD